MAPVHGKNTRVYANGYDLTLFLRKLTPVGTVETADASTFGRQSKVKVAGQKDAKLTAEGLFSHANITAADVDDVLSAALGVENVLWLYGPAGDAIGARAVGLVAIESSYEVSSDVGDVVSVKAEAEASSGNGLEAGVFLFSGSAPIGVTTQGASHDAGALTSNGAVAHLQFPDVAGAAPSVTVKVQHSADNVTFADLATFTAVAADFNAQRIQVAGTVNRYTRAVVTFGGTTTAATVAVALARL
jgi:hypothetical protein